MEQENTKTDEKNIKKPNVMFHLIILLLLIFLLVGLVALLAYFLPSDSSADIEISQLIGLITVVVIIAAITLLISAWRLHFSVRYIQLPVWRWMIGGCKGKPDTPLARNFITREQIAEAKKKMSRSQHVWMWGGNVCAGLGGILLLIAVFWRLVLAITFKETIGSTANMLFLVGFLMIISGCGVVRICIGRTGD
jgi:hypothetical protein